MTWPRIIFLTIGLLAGGSCQAMADGGVLRLLAQQDDCQLAVFAPGLLRAGVIDLGILVQDTVSGQVIEEAQVSVTGFARESPTTVRSALASRTAATNKLFQAAAIELDVPGAWTVEVTCETPSGRMVRRFDLDVAAALPALSGIWPWISWPFAVVLAFAAHRLRAAQVRLGRVV